MMTTRELAMWSLRRNYGRVRQGGLACVRHDLIPKSSRDGLDYAKFIPERYS